MKNINKRRTKLYGSPDIYWPNDCGTCQAENYPKQTGYYYLYYTLYFYDISTPIMCNHSFIAEAPILDAQSTTCVHLSNDGDHAFLMTNFYLIAVILGIY